MPTHETIGSVQRLDTRMDGLVPRDAAIEMLASGFAWSEGPIWRHEDRSLLFSDIPNNVVHRWKEGEGLSVFLKPSGYTGTAPRGGEVGSNGLTLDKEGRLTLCEHGDRRVTRLESDGTKSVLADRFGGQRLNSPNDLVWDLNGDLLFTDPPYGLEGGEDDPARELDFCGVFRVKRDNRFVELVTDELTRPNGLAFSPDRKLLYVANSDFARAAWFALPLKPDGSAGRPKMLLDLTKDAKALGMVPDGFKCDAKGNLFAAGPGGICVITPAGQLLGRIDPGTKVSNCNWGDDGSVLYFTASDKLCRIRTSTRGDRWPF